MTSLTAQSVTGSEILFDFTCPGCGAHGDLRVDVKVAGQAFGCPTQCGSTFVLWNDDGTWTVTCVVQPIYEEEFYEND